MFIPQHLRTWQPEHMKGVPMRRCHWCTGERLRLQDLVQVLEAPMRYHFCSHECLATWQQHRHDVRVVAWTRIGAGTRAKILKRKRDEARA